MKIAPAILLFACIVTSSHAQVLRTTVGSKARFPVANVTSAYTIDPDCAEAEVSGGFLIVTGTHVCTTEVMTVQGDRVLAWQLVVGPRRNHLPLPNSTFGGTGEQSGVVGTYYSSDPREIQSTLSLFRREGDKSTTVDMAVADGYAFSRIDRRTAVPVASFVFAGPKQTLTLFDGRVDDAAVMAQESVVRGVHFESGTWFLHAGFASPTNFQQSLFDREDDRVAALGRRVALTSHSSFTPSVEWVSASRRYISGQSGTVGSLAYEYDRPNRFHFRGEAATGGTGAAGFASLDVDGSADAVRLTARATPERFPSISAGPSRGVQANGSWDHRVSEKLSLEFTGTRDTYLLRERSHQTNSTGGLRVQLRPARRWLLSGGITAASLGLPNLHAANSWSVPVGLGFESAHIGNSFQYQFRKNTANELGSHYFRDSIRVSMRSAALTFFASRQTQAPTVDFVLQDVPALRDAMLAEGFFASTPEQIIDFIRTHSALIATGQLHDLTINIAPVREQAGATFSWTGFHSRLTTRFDSRWDDDHGLRTRFTNISEDARISFRATPRTELLFGGASFATRVAGLSSSVHNPTFTLGIRRQLSTVPNFLRPALAGTIHGRVYRPSDDASSGNPRGISGVVIMLDGARTAKTNNAGEFTFTSVPLGRHAVEVLYPATDADVFTTPPYVEVSEDATVNFAIARRKAAIFGTVLSEASKPVAGVVVTISGPAVRELRTDTSGAFAAMDLEPGAYTVSIDGDSVPPSYAVAEITAETAVASLDSPAEVNLQLRALRTLMGKVVCAGAPVETATVQLLAGGETKAIVVGNGRFAFRDLPSGPNEIVVEVASRQAHETIEVPAEPTNLRDIVIDVCPLK